jgi:hypothetical protein
MDSNFAAAEPFLLVSKLLGFFPLGVDTKSQKIKVQWFGVFLSLCCFGALVALNFFTWKQFVLLALSDSLFLVNAWNLTRKIELSSYFILLFYQLSRQKNILKFLEKLNEFDYHVSSTFEPSNPKLMIQFLSRPKHH